MNYSKWVSLKASSQYLLPMESQNMHCIVEPINGCGGVYLGNIDAANDKELLRKHSIKAVVSALSSGSPNLDESVQKLWIIAQDSEDFPLGCYFDQSYNFIDKHRHHTNILVHCQAGISRSTTLVAAYLMKKFGWNTQYALKQIQIVRKCICPNPGFLRQLEQFEARLNNTVYQGEFKSRKNIGQEYNKQLKSFSPIKYTSQQVESQNRRFNDIINRISNFRTQKHPENQFRFDLLLDNTNPLKPLRNQTNASSLYFSKSQTNNASKSFLTKSFSNITNLKNQNFFSQ